MQTKMIESEVLSCCVFSENKRQRYSLLRKWDSAKLNAVVIMPNPSYLDELKYDYSSMRLMNYLIDVGYGGMTIVNLFSYIETDSNNLPPYNERFDSNTDDYI